VGSDESTSQIGQEHLVLLPGMDGTGHLFEPFINVLPKKFSVTVVSYPADELLDYSQFQAIIEAAVPQVNNYTLVAESFSGPLALQFGAKNPLNLKSIILCASFVISPSPKILNWPGTVLSSLICRMPLSSWALRHWMLGMDCSDDLVSLARTSIRKVSPRVLAHRLRTVIRVDAREALRNCTKPILYLLATEDRLVNGRGLRDIVSVKPEVNHIEIDGPHLLLQRNPKAAIKAIECFLKTQPDCA
jgi:pimeloyl-ACP methyl ester carboxylesterase